MFANTQDATVNNSQRKSRSSKVVGVVGGIASGKSYICSLFEGKGAVIIHADTIGHEVLKQAECVAEIRKVFGDNVFDDDGQVSRRKLGQRVFESGSQGELDRLESIVHPRIRQRVREQIEYLRNLAVPPEAIFLDAPLLFEAGWADFCDMILFVDAPYTVRRDRAMQRGWTESHFQQREHAQMSVDEKRQRSTHVIHNSPEDDLPSQVDVIWSEINTLF